MQGKGTIKHSPFSREPPPETWSKIHGKSNFNLPRPFHHILGETGRCTSRWPPSQLDKVHSCANTGCIDAHEYLEFKVGQYSTNHAEPQVGPSLHACFYGRSPRAGGRNRRPCAYPSQQQIQIRPLRTVCILHTKKPLLLVPWYRRN